MSQQNDIIKQRDILPRLSYILLKVIYAQYKKEFEIKKKWKRYKLVDNVNESRLFCLISWHEKTIKALADNEDKMHSAEVINLLGTKSDKYRGFTTQASTQINL